MSKKHFIALADHIRENGNVYSMAAIERLADFCASQNPAFKRERWISYINGECGKNGGRVKHATPNT